MIEPAESLRTILLDFHSLKSNELFTLIDSLIEPARRSGLHPIIDKAARIYSDLWPASKQLGVMLDSVTAIPSLTEFGYLNRAHAVRHCLSALWSLVFEEGPGKSEFGRDPKATRAVLQVSPGPYSLLLRLCFPWPGKTQRDLLNHFWPDAGRQSERPITSARILAQHADFVRAHTFSESNEVEITIGLFRSAPAQVKAGCLHTLWVEPIAPNVFHESLFTPQGAARFIGAPPQTIPLPTIGASAPLTTTTAASSELILKLANLTRQLAEKDVLIAELKMGGVGRAKAAEQDRSPPDPEDLLEGFASHYVTLRQEVDGLEGELRKAAAEGKSRADVEALISNLTELEERLNRWTLRIDEITRMPQELKETG